MKPILKFQVLFALVLLTSTVFPQNGVKVPPPIMPFAAGEELTYEGKISKSLIRGIAVADLTFSVSQSSPDEKFIVKADARSKGTLTKLFRFSFEQVIESTFDGGVSRVEKTKKRDVQKERVRESEALFNYKERRVTYTEVDPKEPMRPPRKIASDITADTHDMVSAIYRLRTLPLAINSTFEMKVSDSGLVYSIPVKVTRRELQKTAIGRVQCVRVEPVVFGPGRLIEREGTMIIWITDDARRIPVRAQVNTSLGRIQINIKSAKNTKS